MGEFEETRGCWVHRPAGWDPNMLVGICILCPESHPCSELELRGHLEERCDFSSVLGARCWGTHLQG
jgi:hypothetical protein